MEKPESYFAKQILMDHAKHPKNYGLLQGADFASEQYNPSCGDSVTISGMINNGKISKIGFEGKGCVLSLAMASMLTEHVKGMSIEQVLSLDESITLGLLGMSLGPNRMLCGMLIVMALQKGLVSYQSNQGSI